LVLGIATGCFEAGVDAKPKGLQLILGIDDEVIDWAFSYGV
jgi:hypothetical protein